MLILGILNVSTCVNNLRLDREGLGVRSRYDPNLVDRCLAFFTQLPMRAR